MLPASPALDVASQRKSDWLLLLRMNLTLILTLLRMLKLVRWLLAVPEPVLVLTGSSASARAARPRGAGSGRTACPRIWQRAGEGPPITSEERPQSAAPLLHCSPFTLSCGLSWGFLASTRQLALAFQLACGLSEPQCLCFSGQRSPC